MYPFIVTWTRELILLVHFYPEYFYWNTPDIRLYLWLPQIKRLPASKSFVTSQPSPEFSVTSSWQYHDYNDEFGDIPF
jgi:hypothetical protein